MHHIAITFLLNKTFSTALNAGNRLQVIAGIQLYAQKFAAAFFINHTVQVQIEMEINEKNDGNYMVVNGTKRPIAAVIPDCPAYIQQDDFMILQLSEAIFYNRKLFADKNLINNNDETNEKTEYNSPSDTHKNIYAYLIEHGYSINRAPTIESIAQQKPAWMLFETRVADFENLQLSVYVPETLLSLRHIADESQLPENLGLLQKGLYDELGILIPKPVIKVNESLAPFTFQIFLNDLPYPILHTINETCFICNEAYSDPSFNFDHPSKPNHPKKAGSFSLRNMDEKSAVNGYTWGTWGFLILQLSRVLRKHAFLFMNGFAIRTLMDKIYLGPLTQRLLNDNYAPEYITHVFRKLTEQGLTIRNVSRILEGMIYADDAVTSDISAIEFFHHLTVLAAESENPEKEWENPEQMAEVLRNYLRNELQGQLSGFDSLQVLLIGTDIEPYLFQKEDYFSKQENFVLALEQALNEMPAGKQLHCILTLDPIRHKVENMVQPIYPFLKVVSYGELPPETNIIPEARISF